jgi:Domain of unknown function (DUF397)
VKRNVWTTSTRTGSSGQCTEVRHRGHEVNVRDSKKSHGPILTFTPNEWATFIEGIKDTESN